MNKDKNFQTYLNISSKQFGIYLIETKDFKVLYKKEYNLGGNSLSIDINELNKFLRENIFNIEKLIKEFVKNIFLVIDSDKIIRFDIGIKKKKFQYE